MGWFSRFRKSGRKPAEQKRAKRTSVRRVRQPPRTRPRRERYSGWNDPDLPTYGDPFDG